MADKRNTLAHDKEVGRRIRVRRLQQDMSQTTLADALGLTFQQVQKYEKGVNRVGAGRLQQVAKILQVSPSYFFDDNIGGSRNGGNDVFRLLDTAYSLRLMKAFIKIRNAGIQRITVELVEAIADSTKSNH
jgi:transcriptional regulator with XRE-family HTH domain